MKLPLITAVFLTLVTVAPKARADGATQNGDAVYTVSVADPDATLNDSIYYLGAVGYHVYSAFPSISGDANVVDVGDPLGGQWLEYGLFGLDTVSDGVTTNQSVYVGFNSAGTVPINQSFTTLFAPFFKAHPDLTVSETAIVDALQNPDLLDAETNDDDGRVLDQFTDYVINLQDSYNTPTGAAINGGQLTLVHFSDGTAFGDGLVTQVPPPPDAVPEPSTWTAGLLGLGLLTLLRRRSRA